MVFTGRQRALKLRTGSEDDPLRLVLREWFRLVRESSEPILQPDASESKAAYDAVLTAWRELSQEAAHHLYQETRAAYEATSGLCGACGHSLKEGAHE